MWRPLYNAEWERRRQYRLSGHFVQQPASTVLSPIREEPRAEEAERAGEEATEEGPLPPLLVERVPRRVMQDEPEEYYDELEKKIKAYLKKLSNQPTTGKSFTDIHDSYDFSQLIEVPSGTNDTMNEAFIVDAPEPTQREGSSERAGSKSSDTQFCEDVDVTHVDVTQTSKDEDASDNVSSATSTIISSAIQPIRCPTRIDEGASEAQAEQPKKSIFAEKLERNEDEDDELVRGSNENDSCGAQNMKSEQKSRNKSESEGAETNQDGEEEEYVEELEYIEKYHGEEEETECNREIEEKQESLHRSEDKNGEEQQESEIEDEGNEESESCDSGQELEDEDINYDVEMSEIGAENQKEGFPRHFRSSFPRAATKDDKSGNESDEEVEADVEAMRGPRASSATGRGSLQRDARPPPRAATASPRLGDASHTAPAPMELEPVNASPEHFRQLRRSSTQHRLPRVSDAAVSEDGNGGRNSVRTGRKRSHGDPTLGTASAGKRKRTEREGRATADAATQTVERASVGVQTDRTTRLGGPARSDDSPSSSASGASVRFRRSRRRARRGRRAQRFTLIFF